MKTFGVVLTYPADAYLESQLQSRYNLFRLWTASPDRRLDFLRSNAAQIRALVGCTSAGADAETIDALPALEIVASFSVGLDKIDLDKCRERGIRVTNTPDVLTNDVADLAIGLAVACLRRIREGDRFVRSGKWGYGAEFDLSTKFSGKSVGIIGLGRIGLAIAKRAEAFGCLISYYSRREKPFENYKYYSSATELAANCEVLMVACPLTEDTRYIVNREVINALGPRGVLVNIGRGPLVHESELLAALQEGRLGGTGLDVFEHEPDVPKELCQMENVVLVPHVGSSTWETSKAMADLVLRNLEAHVMNKPLLTPVI